MQTLWQYLVQFQKKNLREMWLWIIFEAKKSQVDEKGRLLEA
jgi:hypothetical protein